MDSNPLRPYGDIVAVVGKYTKDGKEKNRYAKVGTLFATPHFSRISIKLDTLPRGEGWLSVFPKEKQETQGDGDKSIDPGDIPF
jgi:hypothetical protein